MTIRLSGQNYFIDDYTFDYCNDKNCINDEEHEWAFDGQIFYRKHK